MGLFGKSKSKQQIDAVMAEAGRNVELSEQFAQQALASSGMDMNALLAAASSAMQPGVMQEMTAYSNRAARLHAHGVETPATLRSIELGEHSPMLGGRSAQLSLTVEPANGAGYDVRTDQVVHDAFAQALTPGAQVTVKVDPHDPQCVMVWGTGSPSAQASATVPPTAAADASGEEPIARLAKLQELREMGALSDEEFQAKKAKLLGEG
jgi:hypothetical protein